MGWRHRRNPAGNYMFKVNNRNTRTDCEICSKLTVKAPERSYWRRSGVFIANFEHISHLFLVSLLLTLNMQLPAGNEMHVFTNKSKDTWRKSTDTVGVFIVNFEQVLHINPFHVTDLFLYRLEISENQWLSNIFRGLKKRPVACNRLL